MNFFLKYVIAPSHSQQFIEIVLFLFRISLGILTMFHGVPKMTGPSTWHNLGVTFMYPLGITFLPTLWGFLGGITEFFGGIFLALGLGTRISSFALTIMMIIATSWHMTKKDSFIQYSFPFTLIFVYMVFVLIGGGTFSFDNYLTRF